jgi:hypothetical protein
VTIALFALVALLTGSKLSKSRSGFVPVVDKIPYATGYSIR